MATRGEEKWNGRRLPTFGFDVDVARKEAELAADAAEANKGCATRTYEKVFGAAEEHAAPQELELKEAASQPLPGHRLGAHKPVVEQVCT
mgnify:CR=1 FL=1